MTKEETEGVKAIVWLQSLAGITEPEEKALKGWQDMSEQERDQTLLAYITLGGDNEDESHEAEA
jgi:hypothetical protein